MKTREQLAERLWQDAEKRGPDECWPWTGADDGHGYGMMFDTKAHRASWEVHRGAIPDGLCVLHKCDNPACVNPRHLFLGTHQDNMRDKIAKGRAAGPRGTRCPHARLNEEQVRNIRQELSAGAGHRQLARKYGVNHQAIGKIERRESWGWLP